MSDLIEDETRLHVAGAYRYRIQFHVDSDASPPWEDDGALPMITTGGRTGFDERGARGFDLANPFPHLKDRALKVNLNEIAQLIGYSGAAALDQDARDYYPDSPIAEARRHIIADSRSDMSDTQDGLETLARVWNMAGVPAEVSESRGYCQGDWAAILTVAHPDAVKAFGFATMRAYRKACPDDHKSAVISWGAYTWGGVIGYTVERIDPAEWAEAVEANDGEDLTGDELNALTECEDVDSCWGFYPEHDSDYFPLDRNHAYAISQAIEAADSDAAEQAERDALARTAEAEADAFCMMECRPDLYEGARA